MGYLLPHGTCVNLGGRFVGQPFGVDIDDEVTETRHKGWVDLDDLLVLSDWLASSEDATSEPEDGEPYYEFGGETFGEPEAIEEHFRSMVTEVYNFVWGRGDYMLRMEVQNLIEQIIYRPYWYDLLDREIQNLIIEGWVSITYYPYLDLENEDTFEGSASPSHFSSSEMREGSGWVLDIREGWGWESRRETRYGRGPSHGKRGRKWNHRPRSYQNASRQVFTHDWLRQNDYDHYGDGRLDDSVDREIYIENYRGELTLADRQYYLDLLHNSEFSLADYASDGDDFFHDEDRFHPHEYDLLDELQAEINLMREYHECKVLHHHYPRGRRTIFVDYNGFGDQDYYEYGSEVGIFDDYTGPDNPDDDPSREEEWAYDSWVLEQSLDDTLDAAAWATIDRQREEEALDHEPAPAFGGSNRVHLRARNPHGDRERYVA